jgi:cation transporter-like permease
MKDLVISNKRIQTELKTILICLFISMLVNVGAIIFYKAAVMEFFTSLQYVILFAMVLYLIWSFLRFVFYFSSRIFSKSNQ